MKIGLALSGGGWRATLYHLGVVRFLRDSDLLAQVSHITSVSGGSVLAAHLALNWDRYCGEPSDFDAAAKEILQFVSLDVRNRIVRRYPGILAYGLFRRLTFRRNARLYSRIGLLEWYYRQHLVGDACLHELPTTPEFHFLSTDVSEGGFSSFTHGRLLIQERTGDGRTHVKPYRAGLAKVATAIAASSAFPAFFPPLELRADDIGATEGEFPTQYLTDGGVFDNLGLRVFHYLDRVRRPELAANDFVDPAAAEAAWRKAINDDERTALRRVAELADKSRKSHSVASAGGTAADMLAELNSFLLSHRWVNDPELLAFLSSGNAPAHKAMSGDQSRGQTGVDTREAIASAFGQALGYECLRDAGPLCDVVLASDAGKEFAVYGAHRSPGFLSTALRASDILMDRVWELERENFAHSPHYLFAAMSSIVPQESDPTALHPEIQAQVARIRTDMDRFGDQEISGLIRHGYCVVRHAMRSLEPAITERLADGQPWDPTSKEGAESVTNEDSSSSTMSVTKAARIVQKGGNRRLWSALVDLRDWATWLYAPLVILLIAVLPYYGYRTYRHARQDAALTRAAAKMREDFSSMLSLLEFGTPKSLLGMEVIEVDRLAPRLADVGLDIISDNRITDLREWYVDERNELRRVHLSRHVLVRKSSQSEGIPGLRFQSIWDMPNLGVICTNDELKPVLRRCKAIDKDRPEGLYEWEVLLDFSHVPLGETVEVELNILLDVPAAENRFADREWWRFEVDAVPEIATSWILLPSDKASTGYAVVRWENDHPEVIEMVKPTHQTEMDDGSVINWSVVHPEPNYTYSTRWATE